MNGKVSFNHRGTVYSAHCQYSAIEGGYTACLLSSQYPNEYGTGRTIDEAIRVLKIRLNQLTHRQG